MKLTSERIRQLMLEELGPTLDEVMGEMGLVKDEAKFDYHGQMMPPADMLGDPDYEGEMARLELIKASKYACDLTDMLKNNDQLPAWIQAKITKASDYLSTVKHYLSDRTELAKRDKDHPSPRNMYKVPTGGITGDVEIEIEEVVRKPRKKG